VNDIATEAVAELRRNTSISHAATLFGLARSSFYCERIPIEQHRRRGGGVQPSALTEPERQAIREVLHTKANVDKTPYDVHASLLDDGKYLASVSSFYRILRANGESTRRQLSRTAKPRPVPVLCAEKPNQVWSWDISPLASTKKGEFFYLYAVLDIYSRFAPGFCVEEVEDKELARALFEKTCTEQGIAPGTLTVHADNGPQMRSTTMDELFGLLKIDKSHSRPHVSNDNAYSESLFKTTKYEPTYPGQFETLEQARSWCAEFFAFYNYEHYHSGIGFLTPASVHFGTWPQVVAQRQIALDAAYDANPERFRRGRPVAKQPQSAWINKPNHTLPEDANTQ
jgi:putative transposase